MEMNSEGSRDWARITGAQYRQRIRYHYGQFLFSSPVVQSKISGGRSRITGMDTPSEARLLEIVLKSGRPACAGDHHRETFRRSFARRRFDPCRPYIDNACFYSDGALMVVYYKNAGVVADFALLFLVLFTLGVMAAFQATLTLPGIALLCSPSV